MEKEEYRIMYEAEETHWWYKGMRRITRSLLDRYWSGNQLRILDAGCGTGIMLDRLRKYGAVVGVDLAEEALALSQERGERALGRASVDALPFADGQFDLVTSFDVICTFEASAGLAIGEFHRVLRTGGLLMIRLPAYDWLRGQHDRAVHIEHRFTTGELRRELIARGFHVERITYGNTWLFPLALVKRLVLERLGIGGDGSDVKPIAPPFNAVLSTILASEARLLRWTNLPFGLSVVALARRTREILPG